MWIAYHPERQTVSICQEAVVGPGAHGATFSPEEIITYRPYTATTTVVNGMVRILKAEQEPPGWFQRICHKCHCEWFLPFVERMAAGEKIQIEEIQAAYFAYNGKAMQCGRLDEIVEGQS